MAYNNNKNRWTGEFNLRLTNQKNQLPTNYKFTLPNLHNGDAKFQSQITIMLLGNTFLLFSLLRNTSYWALLLAPNSQQEMEEDITCSNSQTTANDTMVPPRQFSFPHNDPKTYIHCKSQPPAFLFLVAAPFCQPSWKLGRWLCVRICGVFLFASKPPYGK